MGELQELQQALLAARNEGDIRPAHCGLELFTDRYELTNLFLEYLNLNLPRETIPCFYGDGGNGKSLLLRFLREHCCKRLQPGDRVSLKESLKGNLQNADLAEHIKQFKKVNVIPVAHLDFGMSPRDDVRPQEVFSALLKLRRDLAGHGLRFPLYDFASVWYLHKSNDQPLPGVPKPQPPSRDYPLLLRRRREW